jgi:Protein of unknown function (DUF1499)
MLYLISVPALCVLVLAAAVKWRYPAEPLRDGFYMLAAGDPFLGKADFNTYAHVQTRNEAMLCSSGACLEPDQLLDPVPVQGAIMDIARSLQQLVVDAVTANGETIEPRSSAATSSGASMDFIVRTPVMRFPDTLNVALNMEEGSSSAGIAMLSRSQLGKGDGGANRARLERIATALKKLTSDKPLGHSDF